MKVTGSTIEQLEKSKPKGKCRKWRLWATTEQGRKSRRFEGTWTQATEALAAFVQKLEGTVPNAETFGSYAASWARWRAESGELAPGTVDNDKRALRAFSRTPIHSMRMDEITPEDCRNALLWLKAHPATGEGKLSNTTMNKLHIEMAAIFRQAVDDNRLSRSPMQGMRPPKPDTKEKNALTPDEMAVAVARLNNEPLDGRVMAVWFMLLGGLRRGEACGLYDSDVHDGCIFVTRAVKEANGTIGDPKSFSGKRTVPMPPLLQSKVDEWRELREALGFSSSPTLCCNTRGGVLRPQVLYRWWVGDGRYGSEGMRDRMGCPGLGMHQLRHSTLSVMARHMSPFDLQRFAGWSSIEPAKIYVHDDLESLKSGVSDAWSAIACTKNAPPEEKGQRTSR